MGVSVDECMKYTLELLQFGGIEWLAMRIGEVYDKHTKNEKLTQKEKFIIGLRYSEFLATNNSDEAYCSAERKRVICLNKLGLTVDQVNNVVYNVIGLA